MKITRRFDFDYKPLMPSQSLTVISSVPDKQTFDAASGVYTPDYTLTPLTLRANISVIDLDGVIPSGDVNKVLANIRWYAIEGGVETLISDGSTDFIIGQEGQSTAGQISVLKNIDPAVPLTLRFEAEYVDTRTGQIFRFNLSKLIRCSTEAAVPVLEIDSPTQVVYNPIRHEAKQKVKASLTLAGAPVPTANRAFVWEILRSDGTWSEVGTEVTDYDVEISADGTEATIDRSLMGDALTLRVLAKYDPNGSPATQPVTSATPLKVISFTRRIPKVWGDILNCPYNVPVTPYIFPKIELRDSISVFTDDEVNENFSIIWNMATNKPGNATLTYTKIGEGINPQLSTALMSKSIGGVLDVDPQPRDPWAAWADSDGSILTDADGSILLIR